MLNKIPNYALYEEPDSDLFPGYLHIESIRARSLQHGWKFRPHQHHNLHQIFFILKGSGQVIIEPDEYKLDNYQIISIPPLTVHGFQFTPDTEGWVLTLPDVYLQNILRDESLLLEHFATKFIFCCDDVDLQAEFAPIFKIIEQENATNQSSRHFILRCQVSLLISKIITAHPPNQAADDAQIHKGLPQKLTHIRSFQSLVNSQFKQRWSVAKYAKMMNITPTHLNRICRQSLNISASQFIHDRSLLEAKRLLIYTSMTITEIAYELGFCDLAHFSKFFHQKNQLKPSEFRKGFYQTLN